MEEKFNYFIEHANKRFDRLEEKMDTLIGFRFMLFGMAAAVSFLTSIIVETWGK